jgi:hypothetical protein
MDPMATVTIDITRHTSADVPELDTILETVDSWADRYEDNVRFKVRVSRDRSQ